MINTTNKTSHTLAMLSTELNQHHASSSKEDERARVKYIFTQLPERIAESAGQISLLKMVIEKDILEWQPVRFSDEVKFLKNQYAKYQELGLFTPHFKSHYPLRLEKNSNAHEITFCQTWLNLALMLDFYFSKLTEMAFIRDKNELKNHIRSFSFLLEKLLTQLNLVHTEFHEKPIMLHFARNFGPAFEQEVERRLVLLISKTLICRDFVKTVFAYCHDEYLTNSQSNQQLSRLDRLMNDILFQPLSKVQIDHIYQESIIDAA